MKPTPLSLGVIGIGNFTRRMHLPNLSRLSSCHLHTLCDRDPAVLAEAALRWRPQRTTTNYQEILNDPETDAVLIAVRDDFQATLAVAALAAGKHVYVEKPLARCAEDAARVVAAQAASGKRLAVGFNRRFAPVLRRAREIIQAEGGAHNILIRMADDAWRWAASYPPGHLLRLDGGHLFDELRWLCGCEVAAISCLANRPDDDLMTVRMANGCTAALMLSGHGSMDMPKDRLDVITRRGGVLVEDFVELRTYGFADRTHRETFPGHTHPDHEFAHRYLVQSLGADGWMAYRRMVWELRQRTESERLDETMDAREIRRFVDHTLPNFMGDQGWIGSLAAFFKGIQDDVSTDHATASDGLAATRITDAAIRSRENAGAWETIVH